MSAHRLRDLKSHCQRDLNVQNLAILLDNLDVGALTGRNERRFRMVRKEGRFRIRVGRITTTR